MKEFYRSASSASMWRGYEYYLDKRIIGIKKIKDSEYFAIADGSKQKYNIHINLEKPRNSICDCPHAKDKRIMCKHKVALYFSVFPDKALEYKRETEVFAEECIKYQKELEEDVSRVIYKMTKSNLINALEYMVYSAPEWMYNDFVNEYVVNKRK